MKTVKILLVIILLVFSYQTVNARIINVPADSSTIQKGINGANSGDTVLVARGTYYENIDFLGKNILVASNYIFDRLQATIDSTIINGGGLGRVVYMHSVNGPNAGITGFTITNGRAEDGAGIRCGVSSARISHNVITGDTANAEGGGICVAGCPETMTIDSNLILGNKACSGGGICLIYGSSGNIYGNLIRKNHAGWGGGILIVGGSPSIHNNTIDSNTAVADGGGIDCDYACSSDITENYIFANNALSEGGGINCGSSSPTIQRNTIRKNESIDCGGGIRVRHSYAIIACNLIDSNQCSGHGGGVEFYEDTSSFFNNIVFGNSANGYNTGGGLRCYASAPQIKNNIITNTLNGWGISCDPTSNPYISHNDFWDNWDGNFYGCPPGVGDTSWGENCNKTPCDSFHNIIENPLFDPDSTNCFLLCSSPCIDAGDTLDPVPSGGGRWIDMGAVEYPYVCGDCTGDAIVNVGDLTCIVYCVFGNICPCPLGAADVNRDCNVNIADVVYLANYLFGGGPPPVCGGKEPCLTTHFSGLGHASGSAEISLSEPKFTKDGVGEIIITGKFDVEVAAIQLEIKYDPEKISLSEPALTPRTEDLTIYFSSNGGIKKIDSLRSLQVGIVDLSGEHYILAGTGALVNLRMKGSDWSSLEITKAIFVDRDAQKIPVRITSRIEKAELLAKTEQTTLPKTYSLSQNYPNPFNPETQISYDLPNDSWVKLSIYNIRGQKVKALVDGFEAAGHKRIKWDGTDEDGKKVGSGLYFYRIQAGEFTDTRKMIRMK